MSWTAQPLQCFDLWFHSRLVPLLVGFEVRHRGEGCGYHQCFHMIGRIYGQSIRLFERGEQSRGVLGCATAGWERASESLVLFDINSLFEGTFVLEIMRIVFY